MQKGSATIIEKPTEEPKTQTATGGSFGGGRRKAPPHTPYKRRMRKVGDRIKTPDNKTGIILKIRRNGHEDYLVDIPRVGKKWYSEYEL